VPVSFDECSANQSTGWPFGLAGSVGSLSRAATQPPRPSHQLAIDPCAVDLVLEDDLVDLCKPGDRVAIVGMYKAIPVSTQGSTSGIFKTLIVATNVRQLTAEVTQPTFSQEDMKNIRRMIKRKDLFEVSTLRTLPPAHRSLPLGVVWSKTRIIRISNPGTPPLHPFLHNQRRRSHLTDAPCRRGGVHTTAAPVAKPSRTRGWSDRYHTVHLFNTAEWECVGSGDRGLAGAVHLRARADQAGAHLAAAGWTREEPRQRDASTRRHQREQPTASSQQLH
jgi:hypothetical protein